MNSCMSAERPETKRCPGPLMSEVGWSRRRFLQMTGQGFGAMALAHLLARDTNAAAAISNSRGPHFARRAKRCIFLFMVGGPSQMDLFDPKPALNKLHGQKLPPSFGKVTSQFVEDDPICLGSTRQWGRYGQSGMDMSDLIPHMRQHADRIA